MSIACISVSNANYRATKIVGSSSSSFKIIKRFSLCLVVCELYLLRRFRALRRVMVAQLWLDCTPKYARVLFLYIYYIVCFCLSTALALVVARVELGQLFRTNIYLWRARCMLLRLAPPTTRALLVNIRLKTVIIVFCQRSRLRAQIFRLAQLPVKYTYLLFHFCEQLGLCCFFFWINLDFLDFYELFEARTISCWLVGRAGTVAFWSLGNIC